MSFTENTQLTSAFGYNIKNMLFSKPQVGNVPNQKISYKRINIGTRNPDGTTGELIFETERCFSFGVSPNKQADASGKETINGYTLPLCLWTKDSPTDNEKEWVETFNNVVERCKDHLMDNKDDLEKYDLERAMLKTLNPLYWKKEKGKIVEGVGPTLYAKLIQSKKLDKITSIFDDERGNSIDPMALIGKYCYVKAAIKIESLYIGTKFALQVKLYQAEVRLIDSGIKRLLRRPTIEHEVTVDDDMPMMSSSSSKLISREQPEPEDDHQDENDDHEETGSIRGSDNEEEPEPEPKKVVKKVVVKKVVKRPAA